MKSGTQKSVLPTVSFLSTLALSTVLTACGGSADDKAAAPSASVLAAETVTSTSAIDQVINDMSLPSEALVIDPRFGWQRNPQVTTYAPRGDAIASWWTGNRPTWTTAELSWFTAFEAQGNAATNTRVQVKNLRFYILSEATRTWSLIDSVDAPETTLWKYPFDYVSGTSGAGIKSEATGGVSMKPKYPNFHHGWGRPKSFNAPDVRAVFATIDFRLTLDNPNGTDDRASAKYVVDAGSDYYPDMSLKWSLNYAPGIGNGRMLLATPNWRSATLLVPNKNYGSTLDEMRTNPPPLSTAVTPSPTPTEPPLGTSVSAVSKSSSKCMEVAGASTANFAAIVQNTCAASAANQKWTLSAKPDALYTVTSKSSGKCLDVTAYSKSDGAKIQQYSCHGGVNQLWSVTTESDGYRRLISKNSGKCLSITSASASDGATLEQSACVDGAAHQRWLIN